MLIDDLRPTTLAGVKSLAAQLRRQRGIKYSTALDLAARAADCANFRNARKLLSKRGMDSAGHYVLLTIYWRDEDKPYRVGRETLRIELARPILRTCERSLLKWARGFSDLRMAAEDHFVSDVVAHGQNHARKRLTIAERSLRFMERTGLLPWRRGRKDSPIEALRDKLPGTDHSTHWADAATGQVIVVDEPYGGAPDEEARAAWAARHGWRIAKTSWPGMYNPYDCDLYVVTDGSRGYDLNALVARIDAMPAPLSVDDWAGESAASWETFLSPLAKTPQDVRRARCRGTIHPIDSVATVPLNYRAGTSQRRPKGQMSVDDHIEAGRMIKALLSAKPLPGEAYHLMNDLRSTLENWMGSEGGNKRPKGNDFFEIYYSRLERQDVFWHAARSRDGLVAIFEALRLKLQTAYPDCAPLRVQLNRIDRSAGLFARMKAIMTDRRL